MPANIIWGAALLLTVALVFIAPGLALLTFVFLLPFPTAGLFRLSALIVRGEPVSMRDALRWRSFAKRGLGAGLVIGAVSVVLGFNVIFGLNSVDPMGWALATAAFWGLIILWLVSAAVWPLLLDPLREHEPVMGLIRLALVVILVKPLRYLILMLVLTVVLVVSTILAAALVTISMAFFALAMAEYAIPAADRIEQRLTFVVTR